MHETITLSSGRKCTLQNPALPFLEHYHVLSFPSHQGQPTREEADEIMLIATRKARDLGKRYYSDEECFSLIFNERDGNPGCTFTSCRRRTPPRSASRFWPST
jgi:hypothetical protein